MAKKNTKNNSPKLSFYIPRPNARGFEIFGYVFVEIGIHANEVGSNSLCLGYVSTQTPTGRSLRGPNHCVHLPKICLSQATVNAVIVALKSEHPFADSIYKCNEEKLQALAMEVRSHLSATGHQGVSGYGVPNL